MFLHEYFQYLSPRINLEYYKHRAVIQSEMATIKIGDGDTKIIEMLSKDSRIPYRMMAEQLGRTTIP